MPRGAALIALWLLAGAAGAQTPDDPGAGDGVPAAAAPGGVIKSIGFEGNDVTRPSTLLRELVIREGEPADPAKIERSRQGIQDLGLFRSVDVRQVPVAGGIAVTFVVAEKWYILPIPRLDANSEGESAAGVSVRWFNVAGLNHTLRANWSRRDEEKANKGESTSFGLGYSMPFVLDSPWGVAVGGSHGETPITDFGGFVETTDGANVSLSRTFAQGPASQGYNASASLAWSRQATEGPTAPAAYGEAMTLGLSLAYKDVRYNLYSEEGVAWSLGASGANEGLGSDYSFGMLGGSFSRYLHVGETPHQSVHVLASFGTYHGGPTEYQASAGPYALGGASVLRGYPGDFRVGDFYYRTSVEYLRPFIEDWLRPVVILDAGNVHPDLDEADGRVYASIGVGLRVRVTFLVNVEIEAGVAWPVEGGGQRFFASKV
jgi:outer membrane protein assembly factor BamA